jgi:ankyrin repeat protein
MHVDQPSDTRQRRDQSTRSVREGLEQRDEAARRRRLPLLVALITITGVASAVLIVHIASRVQIAIRRSRSSKDHNAVTAALEHGDGSMLKTLLDRGAQPRPEYLLHCKDRPDLVKLLVDAGLDINAEPDLIVLFEDEPNTAKMIVGTALDPNATLKRRVFHARVIKTRHWTVVASAADDDVVAPLLVCAARNCTWDLARVLVEQGADVNARAGSGKTAMSYSIAYKDKNMIRLLVTHGADVLDRVAGRSAVLSAVRNDWKDIALSKLVIDKMVDVNARCLPDRDTRALDVALAEGPTELAVYLIKRGAAPAHGALAIDNALSRPSCPPDVVKTLMARSPECQRDGRIFVLVLAMHHRRMGVAKMLLDQGVNADGNEKYRPLIYAVKTSDTKSIQLLLDYGAKVELTNERGETALSVADRRGRQEIVDLLRQQTKRD